MKYLAPIPKQFVDQNGLPLSNGAVHVYISGDTQHANVYQDADGEELMPNPARLDSNGAWLGFVTAGVPLDYVVEDKDGNVQFEYEKVVAGSGVANVAIEPVLTSGTKIAECWVDGELLELFAPEDSYTANLPIKITSGVITNNGTGLTCTGENAWAEGKSNEATGDYSHAEGQLCKAKGQASHAGGQACETSGQNSFAHGAYLKTSNQSSCQAAFGMYNSDQKAIFVIGNGTADNNRKDVFKVDSNGDTWVMIGGVLTKVTNVSKPGGIANSEFVTKSSDGGGSSTKLVTLDNVYKNAFGGFVSFILRSTNPGVTSTVNYGYKKTGQAGYTKMGNGQTVKFDYEAKVVLPFIVDEEFDQVLIEATNSASIYDAALFFYAESVSG